MKIDEVELDGYPRYLSDWFKTLVDIGAPITRRTHIQVQDNSVTWPIKVNKYRCPVCGTIERSEKDWCYPQLEEDCYE